MEGPPAGVPMRSIVGVRRYPKLLDLVMLLIPGGKERTEEEYRTLFQQAGFELTRIVLTGTEVSIIEAVKR